MRSPSRPATASPLLVASVDGVGTKLHLAIDWGRPEGAGRDLVNHWHQRHRRPRGDPVAFLDYVAGRPASKPRSSSRSCAGMAEACRAAGVALIGGETAQMPGTYRDGRYDLAGT